MGRDVLACSRRAHPIRCEEVRNVVGRTGHCSSRLAGGCLALFDVSQILLAPVRPQGLARLRRLRSCRQARKPLSPTPQ